MFRTHAYLRWSRGLAAGLGVSLLIGCPALAAAAQTHAGAPGSTALTAPATNPNASMDARNPRQSVLGRSQRDSDNVSSNLEKLFDKGPLQTHSLARSARAAGYRTDNDAVLLDVVLHSYNEGLQAAIDSAGGKVRVISEKYLRASVAVTDAATIEAIADLPAVEHVYPQYQ
ncbi:MAG: hypothetical protein L0H73_02260, partial [Nitrococcus sp.]|nr:hypothetical protein [Nitrococcus sp.]